MASDEERLVVMVEARVRDLEKNMAKGSKTAVTNFDLMRRSSRTATRGMERDMQRSTTAMNRALATTSAKVGSFGKAFAMGGMATLGVGAAAALAPILSVGAALSKARSALTEFDSIAKSAKATGLDGEFFQELTYQADLGGVSVDQLSGALESFARNAGLAELGQGRMVTQLKALNPELLKNIQNAKTQEQRIRLVADAIKQESDASKRAAISSAAFGQAGVRMVEVFKDGSEAIDQTAKKARELGLVVDNEVLASAESMNDELNTATRIMNLEFSKALIDLAPTLISTAELAANVAAAIGATVDAMRDLENRSTKGLEVRQAELAHEHLDLENKRVRWEGSPDSNYKTQSLREINERIAANRAEDAKITGLLGDRIFGDGDIQLAPVSIETDSNSRGGGRRSGRGGGSSSKTDADRRALERYIQSLEDEARMLSMSEEEKRAYTAARQAGTAATDQEISYVQRLNEAIYDQNTAQQQAAETADFFRQTALDSFSALIPAIETGNSALDTLINKLIDAAAQAAILGTGPLAGLMGGGIFSGLGAGAGVATGSSQYALAASGAITGMFANGTDFAPGGPALVGERGAELVNLPRGSQVIPNHRIGSRSGGGDVHNSVTIGDVTVNVPEGTNQKEAAGIGREVRKQLTALVDERIQEQSRTRGMLARGPF